MLSKVFLAFAAASLLAHTPSPAPHDPPTLSEQHKALGLGCKDCHGTKEKAEGVEMEQCLTCHESWAKLKLSAKTAKRHPNPHDGHYPDLDCNNCHHGHKAMEIYCDNCHSK